MIIPRIIICIIQMIYSFLWAVHFAKFFNWLIQQFNLYVCAHMCIHAGRCACTHVEVGEHLLEVASLLGTCGSNTDCHTWVQYLCVLSLLTGHSAKWFNISRKVVMSKDLRNKSIEVDESRRDWEINTIVFML